MSKKPPNGRMPAWYGDPHAAKAAAVAGWPERYASLASECPNLGELLSGDMDEKGVGRPRMKLQITMDDGTLKLGIIDASGKRSGWITVVEHETLGETIQAALEADSWQWTPWGRHK